jgi:hypothetical protein
VTDNRRKRRGRYEVRRTRTLATRPTSGYLADIGARERVIEATDPPAGGDRHCIVAPHEAASNDD